MLVPISLKIALVAIDLVEMIEEMIEFSFRPIGAPGNLVLPRTRSPPRSGRQGALPACPSSSRRLFCRSCDRPPATVTPTNKASSKIETRMIQNIVISDSCGKRGQAAGRRKSPDGP